MVPGMDLSELNDRGWMEPLNESSVICRQCGALVAVDADEPGGWAEIHVAWHMSHDKWRR
jgi:hypothetical protein